MSVASASTLTTATGAGTAASSAGVEFVPYSQCDFLLTWSNEIRLYRVTEKEQTASEALTPALGFRLSSRRVAEISNFIPKPPRYINCVSLGKIQGETRDVFHDGVVSCKLSVTHRLIPQMLVRLPESLTAWPRLLLRTSSWR